MVSTISSHCLDTALGRPAKDLRISLDFGQVSEEGGHSWVQLGTWTTNADGRVPGSETPKLSRAGVYRVTFFTGLEDLTSGPYFEATGQQDYFFPEATVVVRICRP